MDVEGEQVIFTLPKDAVASAIRHLNFHQEMQGSGEARCPHDDESKDDEMQQTDLAEALKFWDKLWITYNELSPWIDPRPVRIVADVQISVGWMHAGYPVMSQAPELLEISGTRPMLKCFDLKRIKSRGKEDYWGSFHELGHNMQRKSWTFEGTTEVTVNIFTIYGLLKLCDEKRLEAIWRAPEPGAVARYFREGCRREVWNHDPFLALHTYTLVIREFGWKGLIDTFAEYAAEEQLGEGIGDIVSDADRIGVFIARWSRNVGRDLRPHWSRWGFGDELVQGDTGLDHLKPWDSL